MVPISAMQIHQMRGVVTYQFLVVGLSGIHIVAARAEVVVPEPVESAPDGKQRAVYVDSQTAVRVVDRRGWGC